MHRKPSLLLILALLLVSACRREPAASTTGPLPRFETGEAFILSPTDTLALRVEIAETPRQHRRGLSRRSRLSPDEGMLFLFGKEQPPDASFWMYRTEMPLSVALLDANRTIRAIHSMEPCRSWLSLFCRRYRAGTPFHSALEVNRGYFERHGIGVGHRVVLRRDSAR